MRIDEKLSLVFGVPEASFFKTFKEKKVFVSELRPCLEGMRLVTKGMLKNKITPVVICDSMMAFCMKAGLVKEVHIFYRRLEGETAFCRTGTMIAALCARLHGINCFLHKEGMNKASVCDLRKIGNKSVTISSIKTYVPDIEELPLALLARD